MLLPFFEWLGNLSISKELGESSLISPSIQAIHLVALAVFMGAVLVVDLRLLGQGLTAQPVARVARGARPWLIWSLLGLLATGIPQLMERAEKEYFSDYFWLKMYFLAGALVFTFTIRQRVTRAEESRIRPFWAKTVAMVSIVLWSGVAISARLIGLF